MQTQEKSKKEEIMKEKNMISKLKQNKRNHINSISSNNSSVDHPSNSKHKFNI